MARSLIQNLYKTPRYWYHVSTTLKNSVELLKPRDNDEGFNRSDSEPNVRRICVSPSLEQCLTAIPYFHRDTLSVYRTEKKVKAKSPVDVFDASVTMEGWIIVPTWFIRIGTLNLNSLDKKLTKGVRSEAATDGCLSSSKSLYRWWIKTDPWQYVKMAKL